MAQTVSVIVSAEERVRLAAIVGDRSRPLKHVQRARIVLHSADRLPVLEVARRASVSRPAVWRWQRRCECGPPAGLICDRRPSSSSLPDEIAFNLEGLAMWCVLPGAAGVHVAGSKPVARSRRNGVKAVYS